MNLTYTAEEYAFLAKRAERAEDEVSRLLMIVRRARALGAKSGTDLNWHNKLFDLLDEADPPLRTREP